MDQIYLFYEKLKKEELLDRKSTAITLAQAFSYSTPSQSDSDSRKKQASWKKFMDSLTWEKLDKKQVKTVKDVKKGFFGMGLPIKRL